MAESKTEKLLSFDIQEMQGDPEWLREWANQLEFNRRMLVFLKTDEGKQAIIDVIKEATKNKAI